MITGIDAALQSQQLQLAGFMATGVAHDVNNQLCLILNQLDFAMRGLQPYDPLRNNLDDAMRAANRCAEMVGGLVELGAHGSRELKATALGPLLRETVRLLNSPGAAPVKLAVEPRLRPVLANATQIQRVLVNLVKNAREAMAGEIRIAAQNEADFVTLAVRDTGLGIPAGISRKIFEPFFSTKGDKSGAGVGLAVAAAIVKDHGGSIHVAGKPGGGTCFLLRFPAISDTRGL